MTRGPQRARATPGPDVLVWPRSHCVVTPASRARGKSGEIDGAGRRSRSSMSKSNNGAAIKARKLARILLRALVYLEIGRASCRERVSTAVGAGKLNVR